MNTRGRVRGRNSFRSLNVRLRLHPLILAFRAMFAMIAGTVAAVAVVFALLGSVEARTSTRLLSDLAEATPYRARRRI